MGGDMVRMRRVVVVFGCVAIAGSVSGRSPRQPWHNQLVSRSLFGPAFYGYAYGPTISANGAKVAFVAQAGDLVRGYFTLGNDVYLRDLTTGCPAWSR
jgi:hypothetical protein